MNSWAKSDSIGACLGSNDKELALRLIKAGPEHRKFLRMIHIQLDVIAPLYWWKEFDTYKIATVANSCSTMHKIHAKPFRLDDFSVDHLDLREKLAMIDLIEAMNLDREAYLETRDKKYWWHLIQMLPSSYNQLRTLDFNYETALNILHQRKGHKLDEWRDLRMALGQLPNMAEFYNAAYGCVDPEEDDRK